MSESLALDKMSIEEKIRVMESLWEDLAARAPDSASPSWHGTELKARRTSIEQGEDRFEDWEAAKKNIKDRLA